MEFCGMLTFHFIESEDPTVEDDCYECDQHPHFSIQCLSFPIGAYRFVVNESKYENGNLQSITEHGYFTHLKAAKTKVSYLLQQPT